MYPVRSAVLIALLLVFFQAGCSTLSPGRDGSQKGLASWYGNEYQGRATASGEPFDQNAMTAAHKKYPFQTIVKVKNLKNGRTVDVRITDRGPFVRGRIIDLSKGAAQRIDMLRDGVVPVQVKVLKWGRN